VLYRGIVRVHFTISESKFQILLYLTNYDKAVNAVLQLYTYPYAS